MVASLRKRIPLQRRKVAKKAVGNMLGWVVALGVASIFVYSINLGAEGEPAFISVGVPILRIAIPTFGILLIAWAPVYEYLYFLRYDYEMDDKNVFIRKGVFAKREIVLPFSRITDVYVDQDLFDAMLGLYDVHISTPTEESGQFAHIDGVDRSGSRTLRDMILERINSATG